MSASEFAGVVGYNELLETEQAIIEILAVSGELPRTDVSELFGSQTEYSPQTATSAGHRLQEKGLIESRPNPANPVEHIWSLSAAAKEWVRTERDAE